MYKKATLILLVTNLIVGIFFFLEYQENKEIQNSVLREYIQSQHSISHNLTKAKSYYDSGDTDAFYSSLKQASEQYHLASHLVANGSIGESLTPHHSIFQFNEDGLSVVNQTLYKLYQDDFNSRDISDLTELSNTMDQFTEELDYNEITAGKSSKETVNQIKVIIDELQ
ncbi:hypothetical protein ABID56_001537 [Alkalibacillus flavidus]|uniref:Uncharacterized protein n=1 Tax=Alkalibacillus flavidus TaxID=546021 RepID=A0ABV2KV48_9BACI